MNGEVWAVGAVVKPPDESSHRLETTVTCPMSVPLLLIAGPYLWRWTTAVSLSYYVHAQPPATLSWTAG